jgi:uncharacterized membrane protein YkvA (DUF1232 family)
MKTALSSKLIAAFVSAVCVSYALWPSDAIADGTPLLGLLDDAFVVVTGALATWSLMRAKGPRKHSSATRSTLRTLTPSR